MTPLTYEQQQRRRPQTQEEKQGHATKFDCSSCINHEENSMIITHDEEAEADCATCKKVSNFRFRKDLLNA